MALQSSGAISLDDIHQEAGGSANSNCSINDADIRGLIDTSAGAEMGFDDFYGASSSAVYGRAVTFGGFNNQGGTTATQWNIGAYIDYVEIASTGNASDFGDLYTGHPKRDLGCAGSNGSRAINYGGLSRNIYNGTQAWLNEIDYITLTSTGNGQDFGNLNAYTRNQGGLSSQTRGIAIHGLFSTNQTSQAGIAETIEYVTIASTGDATDFGDTALVNTTDAGTTCSSTRGVYAGGVQGGANSTLIKYITIASTGDASDFGSLNTTYSRIQIFSGVASSQTRGLFMGGQMNALSGSSPPGDPVSDSTFGRTDTVEYITIGSTGNGTDFGNLSHFTFFGGQTSSRTRALGMGGYGNSAGEGPSINTIQYFTIGSTGNSTDFGDLTATKAELAANSGAHGGVV